MGGGGVGGGGDKYSDHTWLETNQFINEAIFEYGLLLKKAPSSEYIGSDVVKGIQWFGTFSLTIHMRVGEWMLKPWTLSTLSNN